MGITSFTTNVKYFTYNLSLSKALCLYNISLFTQIIYKRNFPYVEIVLHNIMRKEQKFKKLNNISKIFIIFIERPIEI